MTKTNEITVIFDNGGGITLQIECGKRRFQHSYDGMADQCADDIREALGGGDTDDWEGNEISENGWLIPSNEDVRNGGYRIMSVDEIKAIDPEDCGWNNVKQLHEALAV